jgi:hypothetical protein
MVANPGYVPRFGNRLWICGQRIALPTTRTPNHHRSGQSMRYEKRSH